MSYRTYNKLWALAQSVLDENTKIDSNLLTSKINKDKTVLFTEISMVMVNYISAINKLEECYDQVIQPQKRLLIRNILELSIGRYLELRNDMVNLNCNEFVYLDAALARQKILPLDIELTIPIHYRDERAEIMRWQYDFIDEILKKTGFYEEQTVDDIMPIKQAILLIQRHERARQGRLRAQFMKEVRAMNKPDAGEVELSDVARKAAMKIQRVWRGFITRRKIRCRVVEEMLLIGMLPPNVVITEERQKANEVNRIRRALQIIRREEYERALVEEKEKIKPHIKEKIKEDIKDEVRAWYMGVKSQTGKFPDLPSEESGGSAVIYTRYKTASSVSKSTSQSSSKGTKSHKSKSITNASKENLEEKKKKIDEEEVGFKMSPSNFLQELMLANSEYDEVWKGMDETNNTSQRHIESIVKAQKKAEVERELRKIVDVQLRAELEVLQNALDKDNAIRIKRAKKQKKLKRSSKKAKKKRDKDLTPDRTLESLFEELVMNGIIHKYPNVSLSSFKGGTSLVACDVMRWDYDPPPTLGDVRQAIRDNCILPMLSEEIHKASPLVRSVLIAGVRGSGKHMLVNAVCTELGATLFDLTSANIVGKYPGKSGLTMLLHLVNKVARLLQPAIIYIEDAEKTFMKKVPKTDKTDPKRLKKDLPKLVKSIGPTDRILLLGISSNPWDCEQKSLTTTYNKIIVIPRPDYASLYHIWNDLLFQYSGVSRKFNVSMLAKLSSGYSVGTIIKVLQEVMTCKRVLQLTIRPLMHVEILNALARHDPVYKEEEETYIQWYSRTPLGRKNQKALEIELEKRTLESEKHSIVK
ncbi:dynein regulatory complex protein 11 [Daktulosphaira vitifoliae]|uniref:dynein regulatory complex protein 11 n=1 Tax=Daktulosphaira vitifoliae TaxID=58002 RepID=UPI0021AAADD4|nr:dynein regulatory complex protein 11 [Daktulosphaira vitifoliae]